MKSKNQISLTRKTLYWVMLLTVFLAISGVGNFSAAHAQDVAPEAFAASTPVPVPVPTPTPRPSSGTNRGQVCNNSSGTDVYITYRENNIGDLKVRVLHPTECSNDNDDADGVWANCATGQVGCDPNTHKRVFKIPGNPVAPLGLIGPAEYSLSDSSDAQSLVLVGSNALPYAIFITGDYGWIYPLPNDWVISAEDVPTNLNYSVYANKDTAQVFCRCTVHRDDLLVPLPTPSLVPSPQGPEQGPDTATFISDVTIPDGTVVSPGQALVKTWRMRDTGTTTWGSGYQLAFVGGEQMGAPSAVNVSPTAAGNTVDISVNIVAPSSFGTHRGYWQLRNPQGTYFGDRIWVQVTIPNGPVPTSPPPTPIRPPDSDKSAIELTCLDCPATVAPNATFRPTIRVTINKTDGQLSGSRGDMLRNTDNNPYGAWPHVALNGTVNPGQTYDFVFYADHPIQAPGSEGVYTTKWRIWRDGNWAGPELTIQFNVSNGTPGNRPPNSPTATGPGDWSVFDGTGGINLQAQANGDPDGDSVNQYYFEVFESHDVCNSGWTSSNSWSPTCLGYWGYQWRAKVKDEHGAESGWSEVRHFTVKDPTPRIDSFSWKWSDPGLNNGNPWVIDFCGTYNGDGIRIDMYSYATDTWWTLTEGGGQTINCTADPSGWHHRWYQQGWPSGHYKARLYVSKSNSQWTADPSKDCDINTPTAQPPNAPALLYPPPPDSRETYVNSKTVRFDWKDTYRTTNYRLEVSTDSNFSTHLVDVQNIPITTSEYTSTFDTDYALLYWRVTATGPDGTGYTDKTFHIDITPPASAVSALPAITTDSTFVVNWSGSDNRSGLRWYQVQVRDSNRPDSLWADWHVNTTDTSAIFQGAPGHAYYFCARASDIAGNWEDWPPGDGDTYTLINPSAVAAPSWWNQAYSWKRNLVIRNTDSDTVPAHYPMHLRFDTTTTPTAAEIYQAALSNGNDVRVVYNDQTELNRVIQHFSASQIDIWFPLQAVLGGLQSDDSHYQLYYGNSSAGSPTATLNSIFLPEQDGSTIGLWHFQEGSGSTVNDTSGRSHPGSFVNAAWADGYLGNAGYFNGSNAGVDLGSPSDYNALGAVTLEAWVYATSFSNSPLLFYKGIGGGKQQYAVRFNTDGQLEWYVGQNCDDWMTSGLKLQTNHWYHVAAVFDGTREKWIYVNGVEKGHKTLNANCAVQSQSWPLYFGYGASAWPGTTLAGYIQHARISNTARHDFAGAPIDTAPEVKAGTLRARPIQGAPDLAILGVTTYPNAGAGTIVQAVVQNQGNLSTQNGFYTDLYVNHLPTGAGDYTGSVQFWINDPIAAGAIVTLTTIITDLIGGPGGSAGAEISGTLYAQVDSTGVLSETTKTNNLYSSGVEICVASPDAYESDDTSLNAQAIGFGQIQAHNFGGPGDGDWIKFAAEEGTHYLISTSDLGTAADTYLYLYDTDGTTLLASNDDYDGSLASQIEWQAPSSGTYYVLTQHWNPNVGGCGTSYSLSVLAAPTPQFSATPRSGPRPLNVSFGDESTGQITSWLWNFGDDFTSTLQNPTHTYTISGVYTVSLRVVGPGGGDAITRTNYITVNASTPCYTLTNTVSPTAGGSVSVNPSPNCNNGTQYTAGASVTLTAMSNAGYTFSNWSGDAGESTNPVTVTMNANKNVTANYVTTATAIVRTGSARVAPGASVTIPVQAIGVPLPGLGAATIEIRYDPAILDATACSVNTTSFSGVCNPNYDNDGVNPDSVRFTVASVSGASGDSLLANVTFLAKGAAGSSSALDVVIVTFTDPSGNPIPAKDEDGQVTLGVPGDVSCDSQRNVVDAMFILQYDVGLRSASNQCPLPAAPPPTLFLPGCDVSGDGQCNVIDALFIMQCDVDIHNRLCPTTGLLHFDKERVSFQSTLTATLGIGSGEVALGESISVPITTNLAGNTLGAATIEVRYDPTVVTAVACSVDPAGLFDSKTCNPYYKTDTVRFNLASLSGVTGNPLLANVTFRAIGSPGGSSVLDVVPQVFVDPSGNPIPVTDQDGQIRITGELSPTAEFSATPLNGLAPLTVTFTDQSTGAITAWLWNFGDGATSPAQNPTHTYTQTGNYTVTLTVTGPGGTDSRTRTGYIAVVQGAAIGFNPTTMTIPLGLVRPLTITVWPNGQAVNGVQVHARLVPTSLQIITMTPGSSLPVLMDAPVFDPATGVLRYSGAASLGTVITQPFDALVVMVRAITLTTGTPATFLSDFPPTDVSGPGGSVLQASLDGTVEIVPGPDLAVSLPDGGAVSAGQTVTLSVVARNLGSQAASSIGLTATLPNYATFVGTNWVALGGGLYRYSIAQLASGEMVTVPFRVRINSILESGVEATLFTVRIGDDGSRGLDVITANNTATATIPINAAPDLVVYKSDNGLVGVPGSWVTYTIAYSNTGTQDATGAVLTETLPLYTSYAGGSWTWLGGNVYRKTIGNLAVGATGLVSFTVRITDSLPTGILAITNTVRIGDDGSNGPDLNPANNIATDTMPTAAILIGRVDLQGRPAAPNSAWAVSLTVRLYPVDGATAVYTRAMQADSSGQFRLEGLAPGSYDVRVKNSHTLQNVKRAVNLLPGENTVNLGALLEGDVNDDNLVTIADFGILSSAFNTCFGSGQFVENADLNENNCVTIADFGLLSGNFNRRGDITATLAYALTPAKVISHAAQIKLEPARSRIAVGELFTLTIRIEPNGEAINGAMVNLKYDPEVLGIMSFAPGATLTTPVGATKNLTGSLQFALGRLGETVSEPFVLATVQARLIKETRGTSITFVSSFPATDISGPTGSVMGSAVGCEVQSLYRVLLPMVVR
jgi:uncharacterized repeat protein (TIGR01451 family)